MHSHKATDVKRTVVRSVKLRLAPAGSWTNAGAGGSGTGSRRLQYRATAAAARACRRRQRSLAAFSRGGRCSSARLAALGAGSSSKCCCRRSCRNLLHLRNISGGGGNGCGRLGARGAAALAAARLDPAALGATKIRRGRCRCRCPCFFCCRCTRCVLLCGCHLHRGAARRRTRSCCSSGSASAGDRRSDRCQAQRRAGCLLCPARSGIATATSGILIIRRGSI